MNYRSLADISITVNQNLHRIPDDVDLIVGIPRSGLLAGSTIALALNVPIADLESFIENRRITYGGTRSARQSVPTFPREAKHVLIVDDSVRTGSAMGTALKKIRDANLSCRYTTCVLYVTGSGNSSVDLSFERVPSPRAFEWNLFHNRAIEDCCVDIDGVLCVDPTRSENDDGENYRRFLLNAKPLVRPTAKIGALVTNRLEKYRAETREWLDKHNILYDELVMLDLPDAETRRRLGVHAKFKADAYDSFPGAHLFIESNPGQSLEISQRTGRSVLCFTDQQIYKPGMTLKSMDAGTRKFFVRSLGRAKKIARRLLR